MNLNSLPDDRCLAIRRQISLSQESFEKEILADSLKIRAKFILEKGEEKFTFFWNSNSCFSQWYPSSFYGQGIIWDDKAYLGDLPTTFKFNCAEQFMMYHKAMLFLDRKTAKKILSTTNPKEQKRLGRRVLNFDERVWKYYRSSIVYWANEKKFTTNAACLSKLLATKGTSLVEASPYDKTWGIGLSESDPRAKDRSQWKGVNLLGEILTRLRVKLSSGNY